MVKDKDCDVKAVTNVIQQHIPAAELESEISAELSYLLPFDESKKFEQLFNEIESRKSELKLTSFGTTATTMEEVFLKYANSKKKTEKSVNFAGKSLNVYVYRLKMSNCIKSIKMLIQKLLMNINCRFHSASLELEKAV